MAYLYDIEIIVSSLYREKLLDFGVERQSTIYSIKNEPRLGVVGLLFFLKQMFYKKNIYPYISTIQF